MCKHVGVPTRMTVKKKKKRKDKKTKENLLNINLECGWWDSGHGCVDALRVGADRLADECEESKKQQRKGKKKYSLMDTDGRCGRADVLHADMLTCGCVACGWMRCVWTRISIKKKKKDLLGRM